MYTDHLSDFKRNVTAAWMYYIHVYYILCTLHGFEMLYWEDN